MNRSRRLATTILLGAAMQLAPCSAVRAQNPNAPAEKQIEPKASPAKLRSSASGGIQVHGDWTITIRNEDGTVASRHEFKNAFEPGTAGFLASVLARRATVGRWAVGVSGPGFCLMPSGVVIHCLLAEPGYASPFSNPSLTLATSAPQSGPDAGMFILSGSLRAQSTSTIVSVRTQLLSCSTPIAPADWSTCPSANIWPFTLKTLAAGITVAANQSIDVTVKISFS